MTMKDADNTLTNNARATVVNSACDEMREAALRYTDHQDEAGLLRGMGDKHVARMRCFNDAFARLALSVQYADYFDQKHDWIDRVIQLEAALHDSDYEEEIEDDLDEDY